MPTRPCFMPRRGRDHSTLACPIRCTCPGFLLEGETAPALLWLQESVSDSYIWCVDMAGGADVEAGSIVPLGWGTIMPSVVKISRVINPERALPITQKFPKLPHASLYKLFANTQDIKRNSVMSPSLSLFTQLNNYMCLNNCFSCVLLFTSPLILFIFYLLLTGALIY